jgi:hypothetical protein
MLAEKIESELDIHRFSAPSASRDIFLNSSLE